MEGFDDPGIFFSDNFSVGESNETRTNFQHSKKKFMEFIRQFHEGNFNYKYRDILKRNYNLGQYWVEINLEDLAAFDESLAEKVYKHPTEYLPILEEAAKDLADELTAPRPPDEEKVEDIQILLSSDAHPSSLRGIKPDAVSKLIKIPGIIVSASGIRAKATKIAIQCRSCRSMQTNISIKPGLEGYVLPRKCTTEQAGRPKCPLDPFFIMPDKCHCVDFQVLKLYSRCGPRLSKEAGEKLKHRYVVMRASTREHEKDMEKRLSIPITVRQLEAVIRISESLAKMQLQPFATQIHVNEALRLFQVSTLDAAMSGSLAGAEGFTSDEDHEMLSRIEKQLKRRFPIGNQVSEQNIVKDFVKQAYPERAIYKVIHTMIRRGELQHRMQRKMLYRLQFELHLNNLFFYLGL